jgi:membrane protein DedA with SNARE-associated domain
MHDLVAQASGYFAHYGAITVFLGTVFIGESAIIPFFVLAAQGAVDFWLVAFCSYSGVFLTDIFWFCVGVYSRRHPKLHHYYENRISAHLKRVLHRLFEKRVLLSLIVMKYMYGSRLLNLVWLGFRRFDLPEFFLLDILSVTVYILSLGVLGILISAGIALAQSALQLVGVIGLAVVALVILYEVVRFSISKASENSR